MLVTPWEHIVRKIWPSSALGYNPTKRGVSRSNIWQCYIFLPTWSIACKLILVSWNTAYLMINNNQSIDKLSFMCCLLQTYQQWYAHLHPLSPVPNRNFILVFFQYGRYHFAKRNVLSSDCLWEYSLIGRLVFICYIVKCYLFRDPRACILFYVNRNLSNSLLWFICLWYYFNFSATVYLLYKTANSPHCIVLYT